MECCNKISHSSSKTRGIKEYNAVMGGVDFYNRLIRFYRIKIKSKKWTLRLIFHAVDIAVTNGM